MHNPPAFPLSFVAHPTEETFVAKGMTLRDYFAAKAMQAMIAHPDSNAEVEASIYARGAYVMADAMMKERSE